MESEYEAFLGLFAAHRDRVFAFIFSLLPNHADAEDVFQRCSLLLWRKFSEYDRERSFLSWACGIAFYEVRNFVRSAQRDRMQFDSALMTQLSDHRLKQLDQKREHLNALKSCLDSLQPRERELVQQAYLGEATLKDFAQTTGQALQTLYNRMARLRRILLECVRRKLAAE
jgi:RNA polymerase sigma-70 factor (ECF subfamily)